jgi:hypothetical protein
MDNEKTISLEHMVLAPYIQKATALRGKQRYVGGNQFRHALGTLAILLDYVIIDPVLLKASIIHDLFEDYKASITSNDIIYIDSDGRAVYELVMEVTRRCIEDVWEPKEEYLQRILMTGSEKAKILKCADRISNLTDLHTDIFNKSFVRRYLNETKKFIVPMAKQVNKDMVIELEDIIHRREATIRFLSIWRTPKSK